MTINEMRLAVCEKLPKLIVINHEGDTCWVANTKYCEQETGCLIHWPTEGLQVCNEAEKLLTATEYHKFCKRLELVTGFHTRQSATYEQRLEVLCRVWFPERF